MQPVAAADIREIAEMDLSPGDAEGYLRVEEAGFPDLEKPGEIVRFCRACTEQGRLLWQTIWDEARRCHRYADWADHWGGHKEPTGLDAGEDGKVPQIVVDRIGPTLEALTGPETTSRIRGTVRPDGPGAVMALPMDAFVREQVQRGGAIRSSVESDAYYNTWVAAVGVTRQLWVFEGTPGHARPRTVKKTYPVWEYMCDPNAREQNFRDADWHKLGRWMPAKQVHAEYGLTVDEVVDALADEAEALSEAWPEWNQSVYDQERDLLFVETTEWREMVDFVELDLPAAVDQRAVAIFEDLDRGGKEPRSVVEAILQALEESLQNLQAAASPPLGGAAGGDVLPFSPAAPSLGAGSPLNEEGEKGPSWELSVEEFAALQEAHERMTGEELLFFNVSKRWRYHYADICGDKLLRSGTLAEECFTFNVMTDRLSMDKRGWRPRSWVSLQVDQQNMLNKALSTIISTYASVPKCTIIDETRLGAGVTTNQVDANYLANPRHTLFVTGPPEQVVGRPAMHLDEAPRLLYEIVSGLWEESAADRYTLGQGGDMRRVSSKALGQVQQGSSAKHAKRANALTLYREQDVKHLLHGMVAYCSYADVVSLIGQEAAQYLPPDRRQWRKALHWDVIVEDATVSSQEKWERFQRTLIETGLLQLIMADPRYAPSSRTWAKMVRHDWEPVLSAEFGRSYSQDMEARAQAEEQAAQNPQGQQGPSQGQQAPQPGAPGQGTPPGGPQQ